MNAARGGGVDRSAEVVYVEGLHRTSCRWRGVQVETVIFSPLAFRDNPSIFNEFTADRVRRKL